MEVIEAGSGLEGVRKAQDEKPDVILLDMMMPTMDGLETLSALRSHAGNCPDAGNLPDRQSSRGPGRAHDVAWRRGGSHQAV